MEPVGKFVEARVGTRVVRFETVVSDQHGACVVVRCGDAAVRVTATSAATSRDRMGPMSEALWDRLIDRAIRPLFPAGGRKAPSMSATTVSGDPEHDADVLALCGAGAALAVSAGPARRIIAAVRVGRVNGLFVLNPTTAERSRSPLDLVVAATTDGIVMVDGGARQVDEALVVDALALAQFAIRDLIRAITDLAADVPHVSASVNITISAPPDAATIACRQGILHQGRRHDGRSLSEVRPIGIDIGLVPNAHGSAALTRGETQALLAVTLSPRTTSPRFSLHVTSVRVPEHDALAERALLPVLPSEETFPYTMQVVSTTGATNGGSSMDLVCGATLALLDAGVPLSAPVAGVAMGLIYDSGKRRCAITADLADAEKREVDMHFTVAGTARGITALQMDITVEGLTSTMFADALAQARIARLKILDAMHDALKARPQVPTDAPLESAQ